MVWKIVIKLLQSIVYIFLNEYSVSASKIIVLSYTFTFTLHYFILVALNCILTYVFHIKTIHRCTCIYIKKERLWDIYFKTERRKKLDFLLCNIASVWMQTHYIPMHIAHLFILLLVINRHLSLVCQLYKLQFVNNQLELEICRHNNNNNNNKLWMKNESRKTKRQTVNAKVHSTVDYIKKCTIAQ